MKLSSRMISSLIAYLLVVLVATQTPVSAINPIPWDLNVGPYVDTIVYKVIANQDQRILALQAGEVEMDLGMLDVSHLPTLDADPDIDYYSALRNGYGHITINCRDYPLNISGLRRAFAYAFDKERVRIDIFDGFAQDHDSLVPYVNSWCAEDDFEWHYYDDRSDIGNQILDDLGFEINNVTGFRDAPNGEPFDIVIEYPAASPEIAEGVAQIGVDALHALHIDAEMTTIVADISRLDLHGDYDMIFYAINFNDDAVDWLAYTYWSFYADIDYQNPTNFRNATYDSWRNQLLYGTTYEEVFEAASEMQKILHYNVPRLVVYQNTYIQGYRNDQFTGHVEDLGKYISGPWTMRKIQKLDSTFGGIVPVAMPNEPDSFNIFVSNSPYSTAMFDIIHPSLYKRAPDLTPWPDIVESMTIETHTDNPEVPEGHTRFTIDIIQDATWSDGVPLTAEDVAFTFVYQVESTIYGNPAASDIEDIEAALTTTPYRAIIEFSTESYWHFSNFAYDYIIPMHIFNDDVGIGYEGWNTWNPVFDPAEPNVNCGPFEFSDYEPGEFYEFRNNPNFHYQPGYTPPDTRPSISSVADFSYEVGTIGNEIEWFVTDDNPRQYAIYMNDAVREQGNWESGSIIHNVDNLAIGSYTFDLYLDDNSGNYASSSVQVTVVEDSGSTTTATDSTEQEGMTPLRIFAISVSTGSIIVILLVLVSTYRAKRFPKST
jgi:ABC-type transport system substrate-binding protein